ncbi:MAG: hypothetical protein WC497_05085 [Patescibacteria group bacterium]
MTAVVRIERDWFLEGGEMRMPQSLIQLWDATWQMVCHGLYGALVLGLFVAAVALTSLLPSPRRSASNEAWQWDPPH